MKSEAKDEGKKRRLVVYFPEETYKRMWHRAIDEDKTGSAFVTDAVEFYLKASEKAKRG